MKYRNEVPGVAGVTLSPWEAAQLLAFLDPRATVGWVEREPHHEQLEAVFDRLDDAAALAKWLRENVILELPAQEAVHLLTVLETHVTAGPPGPADPSPVLAGVREKLSQSLASVSVLAI